MTAEIDFIYCVQFLYSTFFEMQEKTLAINIWVFGFELLEIEIPIGFHGKLHGKKFLPS